MKISGAAFRYTEALSVPDREVLDTVWALTSPELQQLLVRVRGWSRSRYRAWLADSLIALLLPPT